jgi:homoserine dehydrogenase
MTTDKKKEVIRIGLLGCGVVGIGVWKNIHSFKEGLEKRVGSKLEITKISVRNLQKAIHSGIPESLLTTDSESIVNDPEIDIVCELMGGIEPALSLTAKALKSGKIVVTANKALVCEHGNELFEIARLNNADYFYEASVAGGIPIIKVLHEGLAANRFKQIFGILNGTSNYILTRMEKEGLDFQPILEEARKLGYVEYDESLDLDGIDAAHKTVILAFLAHGRWIKLNQMRIEGIRRLSKQDFETAQNMGHKIKLIAEITRDFETNQISAGVYPCLISKEEKIAHVDDVFNGISVTGDIAGETVMIGRGAGQDPTSSSVISDICDAVLALKGGPRLTEVFAPSAESAALTIASLDDIEGKFYFRIKASDEPGVLSKIADILAKNCVSIATVTQREERSETGAASIMLTTHTATEQSIKDTVKQLNDLEFVLEEPVLIRIFNRVQ